MKNKCKHEYGAAFEISIVAVETGRQTDTQLTTEGMIKIIAVIVITIHFPVLK